MTEPDVTLTDYGLFLLCAWFAWSIWPRKGQAKQSRSLWTAFFASISFASITGGTVHGFFLDEATVGYKILWPTTLLAIGITATCAWMLAGVLFAGAHRLRQWGVFAAIAFVAYASVVLLISQSFLVVILNYLPAMILLFIASSRAYLQTRARPFLWISTGTLISFGAAFIQQAGIAIHPTYFNHNSTYHLVQAIGLSVLFNGASRLQTIERNTK